MKNIYFIILFYFSIITVGNAQWTPQGEGILSQDYSVFGISIVDENTVWAMAEKNELPYDPKVIKTTDGGANWDVIDLNSFENYVAVSISAASDSIAWISLGDEETLFKRFIYKTSDGGNTWESVYEVVAGNTNSVWAPVVKFVDENTGYFVDMFGSKSGRTTNGGATWTTNNFTYPGGYWGHIDTENWWDIKGDTIVWATTENFMKTTNGGQSWNTIPTAFNNYQINSVQISETGKGLAIGDLNTNQEVDNNTYVHGSQNGGDSWTALDPLDFSITCLSYVPGTSESFIGVSGFWGSYSFPVPSDYQPTSAVTNDGGNTWIQIDTGISYNSISFVNPETGWAGRVANADYNGANPAIFKWDGGDVTDIVTANKKPLAGPITISPNPATDVINIDFQETNLQATRINLFDGQGKLIHQQVIDGSRQVIDVADLPGGVYFVKVISEKKIYVGKFVKQ